MQSRIRINTARERRRFGGDVRLRAGEERLRTRRKRTRLVALFAGGGCGLALAVLFVWASFQPNFQIDRVVVEGNKAIASYEIVKTVEAILHEDGFHPISQSNIVLFPRREIERHLTATFPRIASVRASTDSLDERTIRISVAERHDFARWCAKDSCYLMDEHGFLFAHDDGSEPTRTEIFEGGIAHADRDLVGHSFLIGRFGDMIEVVRAVERMSTDVVKISVQNERDFHLTLASGAVLLARFSDTPEAIAANLSLALQSEALAGKLADVSYIDLRFQNRVYYKMR